MYICMHAYAYVLACAYIYMHMHTTMDVDDARGMRALHHALSARGRSVKRATVLAYVNTSEAYECI